MKPTNELRWVVRESTEIVERHELYTPAKTITIHVLQQKWADYWSDDMGGAERAWEWRDIETVKE
jgi:hypothetical protein